MGRPFAYGFGLPIASNPSLFGNELFYRALFKFGGQTGIRTQETLSGPAVFKTAAISHSATCPMEKDLFQTAGLELRVRASAPVRFTCLASDLVGALQDH